MLKRRTLLKLLGVAVVAWCPRRRSWLGVSEAEAGVDPTPTLDGTLETDPGTLDAFSTDFGNLVTHRPAAVLRPGSVEDIVKMVRFARSRGIRVAVNGQAGTDDSRESHSQFGQALTEAGLAIDIKPLATIFGIDETRQTADVGAGVRWNELLDAAGAFGLAPAVLADYARLSVGGTLSVGGIGGHTWRFGTQADNVLELEVVTGAGDHVTCSRTQQADLFDAVLAGCAQVAIIVRARVRLVPAQQQAMVFELFYDDLATCLADHTALLHNSPFDYHEGTLSRRADDTGWRYVIEVAKYFTPPDMPDPNALLAGLHDDRSSAQISTTTYTAWQLRLDPLVDFLKSVGAWGTPHPWLSVFIPGSAATSVVGDIAARLTTADLGLGAALLYPVDTSRIQVPLFRLPNEPVAFALTLLRFPTDPTTAPGMLEQNRQIYDEVVAAGGERYVIGAIPRFTQQDWRRHFSPEWGRLTSAKHRYDPDNILAPGWGIFK